MVICDPLHERGIFTPFRSFKPAASFNKNNSNMCCPQHCVERDTDPKVQFHRGKFCNCGNGTCIICSHPQNNFKQRIRFNQKEGSDLLKIIFASAVMAAFLICFRSLNLFVLIVLASIVYFIILFLVKGIDEEDKRIFKEAINNK